VSDDVDSGNDLVRAVWKEARDLIAKLEGTTVERLSVEAAGTRIEIVREAGAVQMVPVTPAQQASDGAPAPAAADGRHAIVAPLVGTFYRAPQPGADPFVEVGAVVEEGQTVAIVEAMKLMNQVRADRRGRVAEILVTDGDWVEFEQPLVLLEEAEE
jgi:acetyl-CoA carboxylase biotin carboxyl carrier protein